MELFLAAFRTFYQLSADSVQIQKSYNTARGSRKTRGVVIARGVGGAAAEAVGILGSRI